MLDRPERAAEMALAARALVEQQYRPEEIGPQLMDVYETALQVGRLKTKARTA
jgi:hypothetical protein